jgi:hypothetical protein
LYQYTRVLFGLATGAQVLTRLLDKDFQNLKFDFVYHYLNNVVVYSETFVEHLEHLGFVLDRLRPAGLTVKPDKVMFATKEISFLCHVSPTGVLIDPERTRAIRDFPPPKDAKGISRFIGMVNGVGLIMKSVFVIQCIVSIGCYYVYSFIYVRKVLVL